MQPLADLYIKPGCPWCDEAIEFLDTHGISYKAHDISAESEARMRMEKISNQSKVPTLDWHGDILADFGRDELVDFLRKHKVKLEDS